MLVLACSRALRASSCITFTILHKQCAGGSSCWEDLQFSFTSKSPTLDESSCFFLLGCLDVSLWILYQRLHQMSHTDGADNFIFGNNYTIYEPLSHSTITLGLFILRLYVFNAQRRCLYCIVMSWNPQQNVYWPLIMGCCCFVFVLLFLFKSWVTHSSQNTSTVEPHFNYAEKSGTMHVLAGMLTVQDKAVPLGSSFSSLIHISTP